MEGPILQVENLSKHFPIRKGFLRRVVARAQAVERVAFDLYAGETLGVVGESGCGKSTLARLVVRLIDPTVGSIKIAFDDKTFGMAGQQDNGLVDISKIPRRLLKAFRGQVQMVFQDPYLSLNPRLTIGSAIEEVMRIQGSISREARKQRVAELLGDVGLRPEMATRYPHEFSGGQRQRVSIARALAADPRILIADEPVSALDVSVQAQVIQLLLELQKKYELSIIFISHDLSVVKYVSDRVAVMYLGEIVETGRTQDIFESPQHPYTEALLKSAPQMGIAAQEIDPIVGEIPSNINPPNGCKFHPRCRYRQDVCSRKQPGEIPAGEGHYSRCLFAGQLQLRGIAAAG